MMRRADRRGMTLVELLVVTVLGTVVLGAIFQVLVTNQRTYAAQGVRVQDQQTLRAGIDVLFGELREVSPSDGDLLSMGSTEMTVRVSRELGLVCSAATGGLNPDILAKKMGRFLRGDSARVFFENNPMFRSDDDWRTARVVVQDSTGLLTCDDGEPAQLVTLRGVRFGSLSNGDSLTPGSPVRNFRRYRFGLDTWDGASFLVREDVVDGDVEPLVGPLDPETGVEFEYLDEDGVQTTVAEDVRQIQVTLRTATEFAGASGSVMRDSLSARVYTRNTF